MTTLEFRGAHELSNALMALPRAIRQNVLVGAMLAGGGIIQADASARAPRDPKTSRRRNRRLADSIKTVVAIAMPNTVSINVTTKDPVAHLVEFGHQNVPRGPGRRKVSITSVSKMGRVTTKFAQDPTEVRIRRAATGFTPPHPFMRPAFEENKDAVLAKIAEVLGVGIATETASLKSTYHELPTILGPSI